MTNKLILHTLLIAIAIILLPGKVNAQSTAIKNYYDKIDSLKEFHGNVLLASAGEVVLERSYGFADIRLQHFNNSGTHFNLASVSKIFTATAILQLKEKRKLTLDDKVQLYLPAFPYKKITLRHLLTHTSGLPNYELFESLVKQYPDTCILCQASNFNTIIMATACWQWW
jgi:CubicO group peptidase (beta-lactamase class C family)